MPKGKIRRDRSVRKGFDAGKVAKMWRALKEAGDYVHISGLAQMTKLKPETVRYYLDHYFKEVVETQRIAPSIKLRLVRLKSGPDLERHLTYLRLVKESNRR